MDNTKRKGAISVTITYICWGLLTVFWNLLAEDKFRLCTGPESSLVLLLCLAIWQ